MTAARLVVVLLAVSGLAGCAVERPPLPRSTTEVATPAPRPTAVFDNGFENGRADGWTTVGGGAAATPAPAS